jgi:hypothetical protein
MAAAAAPALTQGELDMALTYWGFAPGGAVLNGDLNQ